ncbi:hypothetical protein SAMN05444166_2653 [Singulisphaera sp. GP187]|uniref:hypothetical protein n=1 Tax=Singulisphaera sp. GP187 TaxID=1882752 RepID=UPI00092B1418|nr:hypothetical protein [Singulisphaera sp. GP187]SIO13797.1 hypothetical protein SAMN05444166_2653 [Singulisphaera sp. GP187]
MGKRDRLSHDQKRKAKLKQRAERTGKHEKLAYSGRKYKTEEFAPILFRTEVGIYESYVICGRELTDDLIEAAIERMVIQMRKGPLPHFFKSNVITVVEGNEEELVIESIRRNWEILEEKGEMPGRDDLIGVLRTILHSLDLWRSQTLHPQGYLHFLEGFMKKLGVSIEEVRPISDTE